MTEMLKIRLICDLKIEKENYGVNLFRQVRATKKKKIKKKQDFLTEVFNGWF